jgi:putative transposase
MLPGHKHRKDVRHYEDPAQARELTFSCYQRMPLLTNDTWKAGLSRSIDAATTHHGFDLVAFVYMPEHVHLLVVPRDSAAPIDALLYAIKRPFSYRVKMELQQRNDPLLRVLAVQERPGRESFRFWQEGPGYDRNLIWDKTILKVIDYIHNNPVRRGLCELPEQWKWSSWRFYNDPGCQPDPDLPRVRWIDL